jgi:hypothetical protein
MGKYLAITPIVNLKLINELKILDFEILPTLTSDELEKNTKLILKYLI